MREVMAYRTEQYGEDAGGGVRRGNFPNRFKDFYLNAKAIIWP